MADFKKTIATAKAKVAEAETKVFMARLEAIARASRGAAGMSDDRIATTEARLEGFYWVVLGQNPPEIAYWERGEGWLAGDPRPWQPEAVTVASDRLVFKPRLAPVA
jgi:hypothetical protein